MPPRARSSEKDTILSAAPLSGRDSLRVLDLLEHPPAPAITARPQFSR
jgi:hypothetical protein